MKREKLIRARLAKGLSQKVVAELIGVSRNTWSLWELGKEDPYPINIGELCAFFGVKEPGELDLEPRQLRTEKMDTRDSCAYCTRSFQGAREAYGEVEGRHKKWEQLIRVRERLHLSQAEAAERANVGLTTYQRWELCKL
jgi:transcriptional regulator with XRE-family HTH domain